MNTPSKIEQMIAESIPPHDRDFRILATTPGRPDWLAWSTCTRLTDQAMDTLQKLAQDKASTIIAGSEYKYTGSSLHWQIIATNALGVSIKANIENPYNRSSFAYEVPGKTCEDIGGNWDTLEWLEDQMNTVLDGPPNWKPRRTDLKIDAATSRPHTLGDFGFDAHTLPGEKPFSLIRSTRSTHNIDRTINNGSRQHRIRIYDKMQECQDTRKQLPADTRLLPDHLYLLLQQQFKRNQYAPEHGCLMLGLTRFEIELHNETLNQLFPNITGVRQLREIIETGTLWRTGITAMTVTQGRDENISRDDAENWWDTIRSSWSNGPTLIKQLPPPGSSERTMEDIHRKIGQYQEHIMREKGTRTTFTETLQAIHAAEKQHAPIRRTAQARKYDEYESHQRHRKALEECGFCQQTGAYYSRTNLLSAWPAAAEQKYQRTG